MIVGIDIGGTKTHVRAESTGVTLLDRAVPTAEWQVDGRLDSAASVERLLALFGHLPGADEAALAVGAHGLDSDAQAEAFQTALADARPGRTWTVNDVELLGPAAPDMDELMELGWFERDAIPTLARREWIDRVVADAG